MAEEAASVGGQDKKLEKWSEAIFILQRKLSGGYNDPPSDIDARRVVENAEKLAKHIESSGLPVTGSLKNDFSHFYNTATKRDLNDVAPTVKKLAGL